MVYAALGAFGELGVGGREKCGWCVGIEADGVDVCVAVDEAHGDRFVEDDLDVRRALKGDGRACVALLDLKLASCA